MHLRLWLIDYGAFYDVCAEFRRAVNHRHQNVSDVARFRFSQQVKSLTSTTSSPRVSWRFPSLIKNSAY